MNTQTTAECLPSTPSSRIPIPEIDERDERYSISQEILLNFAALDPQSQIQLPDIREDDAHIPHAAEPSDEPIHPRAMGLFGDAGERLDPMPTLSAPCVSMPPPHTPDPRYLSTLSTSPVRDSTSRRTPVPHVSVKRNFEQPSLGSEDSFAGSDQSPRNAQDFIRHRSRLEEERVKVDGIRCARLGKARSMTKKPKELDGARQANTPNKGNKQREGVSPSLPVDKSASAPWVPPSSPRIPLRSKTVSTHPTVSLDPMIFVQSTPTNSNSRSSGLSNPNPISPTPKYAPSLDASNPPFARPTPSLEARSQPAWVRSNQPSTRDSQNSLSGDPGIGTVPSTPKTSGHGHSTSPHLITPTQPISAPAVRMLRPRQVTGAPSTLISPAFLPSNDQVALPLDPLFPESLLDRATSFSASENVDTQALLPPLTLGRHQGKEQSSSESHKRIVKLIRCILLEL
ncbi:hypothetical protein BS47DRAFT_634229 [Hydnum rufescens UP504]|uniref:Uncharacterized protein n=1 Tax=Hydnum rufescens UP504 TaxID=1448309 RepID=A0A9P6B9Y4_9AGAM|nr:hypothetical protein BS47DRAFT_634229 [Hydnum rufescens UP504]